MSVIKTIKSRVSNPLIDDSPISDDLITEILDTAVCTPVHYNTNPWRFLILQGDARKRFGDFLAARAADQMDDTSTSQNQAKLEKIRNKPLRALVIIVVGAAKSSNPKARMVEDVASVNVACQNILLAAQELELAAIWRTGAMTYDDKVVEYLGFEENTQLVGFIYIGQPQRMTKPKKRKSSSEFTRWMSS